VAALSLVSGCSRNDAAPAPAKTPTVPVTVAQVMKKPMALRLQAIGTVEPLTSVAVKARIDSQITAVHFRDGQDVTRGQVLFELDRRTLDAQVKQLQATAQRDLALVNNAIAQEQRQRDLLEKKFISDDAYAQTRTNLDAARATLAADEAILDSARTQLGFASISSPISGQAGKILIQVGNVVKANDTAALVVINEISPIYVSFAVPEQYLPDVRSFMAKNALSVQVAPSGTATTIDDGRLTFVDNTVDSQTGTIRLRATFPNANRALWPGQFATVTLLMGTQSEAIVVPSQAIQNGPKGQYTYVVKEDTSVEMRPVVVDRSDASESVISKGLAAGETVVVSGQIRLVPGAKVQVKPAS
jgi:multidrug efflux system membrane fusion protein